MRRTPLHGQVTGLYCWGIDVQTDGGARGKPTSYVKTSGSWVTRTAESCWLPTSLVVPLAGLTMYFKRDASLTYGGDARFGIGSRTQSGAGSVSVGALNDDGAGISANGVTYTISGASYSDVQPEQTITISPDGYVESFVGDKLAASGPTTPVVGLSFFDGRIGVTPSGNGEGLREFILVEGIYSPAAMRSLSRIT